MTQEDACRSTKIYKENTIFSNLICVVKGENHKLYNYLVIKNILGWGFAISVRKHITPPSKILKNLRPLPFNVVNNLIPSPPFITKHVLMHYNTTCRRKKETTLENCEETVPLSISRSVGLATCVLELINFSSTHYYQRNISHPSITFVLYKGGLIYRVLLLITLIGKTQLGTQLY